MFRKDAGTGREFFLFILLLTAVIAINDYYLILRKGGEAR